LRRRSDLDNILLMALRKDPKDAMHPWQGFARDIRRHLEDRPVTRGIRWLIARTNFAAEQVGITPLIALPLIPSVLGLFLPLIPGRQTSSRFEAAIDRGLPSKTDPNQVSGPCIAETLVSR
jgi:hypothetical protein